MHFPTGSAKTLHSYTTQVICLLFYIFLRDWVVSNCVAVCKNNKYSITVKWNVPQWLCPKEKNCLWVWFLKDETNEPSQHHLDHWNKYEQFVIGCSVALKPHRSETLSNEVSALCWILIDQKWMTKMCEGEKLRGEIPVSATADLWHFSRGGSFKEQALEGGGECRPICAFHGEAESTEKPGTAQLSDRCCLFTTLKCNLYECSYVDGKPEKSRILCYCVFILLEFTLNNTVNT